MKKEVVLKCVDDSICSMATWVYIHIAKIIELFIDTNNSHTHSVQSNTRESYPLALRQCSTISSNYQAIRKTKIAQ